MRLNGGFIAGIRAICSVRMQHIAVVCSSLCSTGRAEKKDALSGGIMRLTNPKLVRTYALPRFFVSFVPQPATMVTHYLPNQYPDKLSTMYTGPAGARLAGSAALNSKRQGQ